jgi:sialidase-1
VITRRSCLALAPALLLRAQPKFSVSQLTTISAQPSVFHGWPTLARRPDGELLVAYSGSREAHVCPFGRVELIRSHDNGQSWTWPEVLIDTAIDDRDAGLLVTPTGAILATTFTSLAYEKPLAGANGWPAERRERWQAAHRRLNADQRQQLLGTWLIRSADAGLTWSAPYRVPLNSPHGPIALAKGRLLYPGVQLWEKARKVGVAESKDDGRTWRWLSDIPTRPGDDAANYHELHGVEAADGRIVVHIRNHNPANDRETLQCESTDGGKTWSVPHAIGVWGLPSHLLRLQDGRLLMSYGYRRTPRGNHARLSSDHGRTWSEAMVISTDGGVDIGYPSTVQLADATLVSVWYERPGEAPYAQLRMARWSLA